MSVIEQRIKKNNEVFDSREPQKNHLSRFEARLAELHADDQPKVKKIKFSMVYRIAAAIVLLIAVSVFLFTDFSPIPNTVANEMSDELLEMNQYYANLNKEKYAEIEKIVGDDEEIDLLKEKAMRRIERLEDETESLQKEYVENNKDERVFSAIAGNYKLLSRALDRVIESISNAKHKKSSY